MFRIYYEDGSMVEGSSKGDWKNAPKEGVQVVVGFPRIQQVVRWCYDKDGQSYTVRDRDLWTGEDEYDPFGYGVKYGSLIDTETYFAIWVKACADP